MNEHRNFDLRDEIFGSLVNRKVTASIIADDAGVISETDIAAEEAKKLGLVVEFFLEIGSRVKRGDEVIRFSSNPKQIAMAEEILMGIIAKPSGIATAMHRFMAVAGPKPKIVCGAWKKMPPQIKDSVRRAIVAGGGAFRITTEPFIYLDKNYIEMFRSIQGCLTAVAGLDGFVKVVQIKGRYKDITMEACEAVRAGAAIVFIDTGRMGDIGHVSKVLSDQGLRRGVRIAYAGNIRTKDILVLKSMDVDILDVGRAIVDAPLLDMRLEVLRLEEDIRKSSLRRERC